MKQTRLTLIFIAMLLFVLAACSSEQATNGDSTAAATENTSTNGQVTRPEGWTEDTHGSDTEPNYEVVFPQDEVNQLTITIDPEDWEAMQANMTELLGEPGQRGPGGQRGDFAAPPNGELPAFPDGERPQPSDGELPAFPEGGQPPAGEFGGRFGGMPGGGGDLVAENPMWVAATIEFEGNVWTNVGVRYKGNSSLQSGWNSSTLKLPFKLDFDQFEDEYPEIDDQRFYGFKQLSLANGFGDSTFMRDTISYELLAEAGLVAAETAYYEVILDYGEGPVDLGLYVMIEVADDTVIDRYFDGNDGNIYEGDGAGVSLAEGTYDLIAESFQKENNEDEADWSDIEALYDVLHSVERTSEPETWRASLEAVFDVDAFLEWLAISAVLQNWDNYGSMTHNFYLYNDPDSGQLTWISWDHNMILGAGPGGPSGPGGGMGMRSNVSLDKAEVDDNWPLIRYLLDDPTYYERYLGYLAETAVLFDPDEMAARYEQLAELIGPYAADDVGEDVFETAVRQLIDATYERAGAVAGFLNNQ